MSAEREAEHAATRTPRLTPGLVVVAMVALVAVVAAGTAGGWWLYPRTWFQGQSLSDSQTPPQVGPPEGPPPLSQAGPVHRWIAGVLTTLLGLALLAALVYLGHWLWQRRPRRAVLVEDEPDTTPAGAVAAEPDLPTLLRGAESAERILAEPGGLPRDLVLRCWLALEEAAADSGMPRRPADSPTEFTAAVLRSTPVEAGPVDTLLRIYHRARFSRHPIGDDDIRTARSAVVRLAATWRGFDTAMRHTARTDT